MSKVLLETQVPGGRVTLTQLRDGRYTVVVTAYLSDAATKELVTNTTHDGSAASEALAREGFRKNVRAARTKGARDFIERVEERRKALK